MATLNWLGVVLLALLAFAIVLRGHQPSFALLLLPLVWLAPLALAGIFVEASTAAKSADWIRWVALASLAAFLVSFPLLTHRLKTPDFLAAGWFIANGVLTLSAAFVSGMAADGTWL